MVVAGGVTTTVEIAWPSAAGSGGVSGTVSRSSLPCSVELQGEHARAVIEPGEDGSFSLDGLPPGGYGVRVQRGAGSEAPAVEVVIERGAITRVTLP